MKKNLLALVVVSVILFMSPHAMPGQTTGFRYDGKLDESRMVLDGKYELVFRLYDAATSGRQIATEIWLSDVVVADGSFRVVLDFGPVSFTDGGDRYIEFAFRPAGTDVPLATTTKRQKVMSVPYAIKSLDADTAATATNALQLAGVAAEQYVKTDDPRLKGPKVPEPANATSNFVLNTTTLQQSSNFHISGDGRASGSLSGGIVNATSRFTIGVAGNHVLSAPGFKNLFAGAGAGGRKHNRKQKLFFRSRCRPSKPGCHPKLILRSRCRQRIYDRQSKCFLRCAFGRKKYQRLTKYPSGLVFRRRAR
jgi:hypothetical protein